MLRHGTFMVLGSSVDSKLETTVCYPAYQLGEAGYCWCNKQAQDARSYNLEDTFLAHSQLNFSSMSSEPGTEADVEDPI